LHREGRVRGIDRVFVFCLEQESMAVLGHKVLHLGHLTQNIMLAVRANPGEMVCLPADKLFRDGEVSPAAVAAVDLDSPDIGLAAVGTAVVLLQPAPDAPRVVLVPTGQFSRRIFLQANHARTVGRRKLMLFTCVRRPFYRLDALVYPSLLLWPFHLLRLLLRCLP
jgi:hypothetical protein